MSSRRRVTAATVPEPPPKRWSNCIVVGGVAYVSGMVARNAEGVTTGDEYEQAMTIFGKIHDLLAAAGGSMQDIVKMTIFVTRMSANNEIWRAREQWFEGDFPASTLVEVSALAKPEILVEIEVVAYLGCSDG